MTDAQAIRPVKGGSRIILIGMGLGLAGMIAAVLLFRLSGPGLIKRGPMPQSPTASAMPSEVPAGMEAMMAMMEKANGNPGEETQNAMVGAMQRLQADPNNVDALLELADLFMEQENFGSSQGFLNRAMVAAPADPRPPYYQGILKTRQGDYQGAAVDMERSLQLLDSPATRYSLGNIYIYYLSQKDKGLTVLREALNAPGIPQDLQEMIQSELAKHAGAE